MWKSIFVVALGGAVGTLLRWWLGLKLNSYFPTIPPGTIAVNFIAAYVIGAAIAFFSSFGAVAPEWRLLIITGFCGGLSTFSTFSAEIVTLMRDGRLAWACGEAAIHLCGSLLMTVAGIGTVEWLKALVVGGTGS